MKIGNKYNYYTKYKKPIESDYENSVDYISALVEYKLMTSYFSGFYLSEYTKTIEKLKQYKVKSKYQNTLLKIGEKVYIDRWDGNGNSKTVKIINIEESNSRVLIKCNKGWFVFSKWNCNTNDINFNWTCKGKEWEKQYMKWINGKNYYYENRY